MSAILSADDLNDFINPGVACIKPVETLADQPPLTDPSNPYEVTTEDKVNSGTLAPSAQISLTDCLACSGCVTSAEAVLVSLQSHGEVLDTLNKYAEIPLPEHKDNNFDQTLENIDASSASRVFIASVSPQTRASIAATYQVSEQQAGHMIEHLLSGPRGLRSGGQHGSGFAMVIDTNAMREVSLVAAVNEMEQALQKPDQGPTRPVITSACPGWICYAEKTHPHILPHLSRLKSPQALTGIMIKSVLARKYGVSPQNVWHLAVMPCFDKKLEASRSELTSHHWHGQSENAVRDVDCVITARELIMLAESRNISFTSLSKRPLAPENCPSFPDPVLDGFLRRPRRVKHSPEASEAIGTSGGYLYHVLKTKQSQCPGSTIRSHRGRNNDVSEYAVVDSQGSEIFTAARYYGFRNIQNLVRKLKPARVSRLPGAVPRGSGGTRRPNGGNASGVGQNYGYVEVMACPGGCTNGGGQIKTTDVATLRQAAGLSNASEDPARELFPIQRDWLAKVDEAYWSADDTEGSQESFSDTASDTSMGTDLTQQSEAHDSVLAQENGKTPKGESLVVDGIDTTYIDRIIQHWASITSVDPELLLYTTYRVVESDVGKGSGDPSAARVAALAQAAGGGW